MKKSSQKMKKNPLLLQILARVGKSRSKNFSEWNGGQQFTQGHDPVSIGLSSKKVRQEPLNWGIIPLNHQLFY